jgi:hypothetical protein
MLLTRVINKLYSGAGSMEVAAGQNRLSTPWENGKAGKPGDKVPTGHSRSSLTISKICSSQGRETRLVDLIQRRVPRSGKNFQGKNTPAVGILRPCNSNEPNSGSLFAGCG